jgi:hypothetical protein
MKLFHVIVLASAGAATVLGAGAVAEKSAVSLGPHFSQAASELLGMSPARWNEEYMLYRYHQLRMCRTGQLRPGFCFFLRKAMSTGEDRDVTRECEIKCRQFPDYHCFDTCKRGTLDERYDGEFAHSMYLLRKRLGMLTMLERWGLGFLQCPLDLLDESLGRCKTWSHGRKVIFALAGASLFHLLSIALYYARQRMPYPGTPETVRSGLLRGSIICSCFGSVFIGIACGKLLKYGAGDGKHALASFCALFAGTLYYAGQRIPNSQPARLCLLILSDDSFLTTYPHVALAMCAVGFGLGFGFN